MREEAPDRDVIDRLPIGIAHFRTDVGGEDVEISGISLDRVGRGVALPQVAEEVIGRAFDDGALMLFHNMVSHTNGNSPQRQGSAEEGFFLHSLSRRSCFIRNQTLNSGFSLSRCLRGKSSSSLSPADDASHTRSSAGRAPHGYKSAWSKCRNGRESFARCGGRRHSPPYEWRRSAAACADWRDGRTRGSPSRLTARPADGSDAGLPCLRIRAASFFV